MDEIDHDSSDGNFKYGVVWTEERNDPCLELPLQNIQDGFKRRILIWVIQVDKQLFLVKRVLAATSASYRPTIGVCWLGMVVHAVPVLCRKVVQRLGWPTPCFPMAARPELRFILPRCRSRNHRQFTERLITTTLTIIQGQDAVKLINDVPQLTTVRRPTIMNPRLRTLFSEAKQLSKERVPWGESGRAAGGS